MQALACPDCGAPTEDEGLCVRCYDRVALHPGGAAKRLKAVTHRNRIRELWRAGWRREDIAVEVRVSLRTVDRYKPPELKAR